MIEIWKFLEIGFNFYFQVQCLDGVELIKFIKHYMIFQTWMILYNMKVF